MGSLLAPCSTVQGEVGLESKDQVPACPASKMCDLIPVLVWNRQPVIRT